MTYQPSGRLGRRPIGKRGKQLRNANARQQDKGPEFEATGTHILILIAVVFAAAWCSGLLPDP